MIKLVLSLALTAAVSVSAQGILFSTDFATKPVGIATLSKQADALGGNAIVIAIPEFAISTVYDTVVDGCTFGLPGDGSEINISRKSQKPVTYGDAGASNGRLHLKNTRCYIQLPSVPGPCTITYYAAGTSAAGKSLKVYINDTDVPEAGFSDLSLNALQAVRKMTYTAAIAGPVVFKLEGRAGVYIYDIEVVSSDVGVKHTWSNRGITANPLQITSTTILNENNDRIRIFNAIGTSVLTSDNSVIDIQSLVKGVYFINQNNRIQQFTVVR